jgi:hypothetical protein
MDSVVQLGALHVILIDAVHVRMDFTSSDQFAHLAILLAQLV